MEENQEGSIYRKNALKSLSSPDKIDQLVTRIKPSRWSALFAIIGLIFLLIVWSIFGYLPQHVAGTALLIKGGGIINVTPNTSGQITDISVEEGDIVSAGQALARIDQSELQGHIFELTEQHDQLIIKTEKITQMLSRTKERLIQLSNKANELLAAEKRLSQSKMVTQATFINTEEKITSLIGQMDSLTIQRIESQNALDDTQRKLLTLNKQYQYRSKIVAPTGGRVIEIKVNQGDFVDAKTPVVSIEQINNNSAFLEAYIYVSAKDGKKIKPGMTVNIAPSTIEREKYGTMMGNIIYVSPYPATFQGIMKAFQNESLVNQILAHGAVFEVIASITPDSNTYSGYKWTSPKGPPAEIQSGMLGEAEITYRRVHPIALIIPIFEDNPSPKKIKGQ